MTKPLTLATLIATCAALAAARDDEKHGAFTPEQAGKTFRETCMSCHLPPDPAFATDRAWLDQVRRTA